MARIIASVACIFLLISASHAAPDPPTAEEWATGKYAQVRKCLDGTQALESNVDYQNFLHANRNCHSGSCDVQLDTMKAACNSLGKGTPYETDDLSGVFCRTTVTAINGAGEYQYWTEYRCVPNSCGYQDYAEDRAVDLVVSGGVTGQPYQHAYAEGWCDWPAYEEFIDIRIGDHILQLLAFGACVLFAHYEKQRRWGRMSTMWPGRSGSGGGSLRTELFGCCPWKAGCNVSFFRNCCCWPVMAVMNRNELDDRQFLWSDICCLHGWCVLAYHNRQAVRERLDAPADGWRDCCTVCWCTPCTIAQNTAEIELGLPAHGASAVPPTSGVEAGLVSSAPATPVVVGTVHDGAATGGGYSGL